MIDHQYKKKEMLPKLLVFDLDGTLLRSDKTISKKSLFILNECRKKQILIGVSTSRSEANSLAFLADLNPDVLITSGGALVKKNNEYIYKAKFSLEETQKMIQTVRDICGEECEITIDTIDSNYWNYKIDPRKLDQSWGDSIWTDFSDFTQEALKMCVEIFEEEKADRMKEQLSNCDCARFSDGFWYKYTRKGVTKEQAIYEVCNAYDIMPEEIMAFGDDFADVGMLKLAGVGVAMGNAVQEVKDVADLIIGSNEEDGIALFLEELLY